MVTKEIYFYSGKTRFAKEQWHVDYVFSPTDPAISSLLGKWIGFKFVVYNFVQNGKTVVKTQNWLNVNNDKITWVKVDQNIDAGG